MEQAYRLVFAPEVISHVAAIDRKYHNLIRRTIQQRLVHEPAKLSRNRKPLEPPAPFDASWELRFGPQNRFRVFYDIDDEDRSVAILAIGVKDRERLQIGAEDYTP
jgi:mRNA-degrading endonuclease RelE of RelBE toxin-antitoxin system